MKDGGIYPLFQGKRWKGIKESLKPTIGFWNSGLEFRGILGIPIINTPSVNGLDPKGEEKGALKGWVTTYPNGNEMVLKLTMGVVVS